jgi:hypothetical protein
VAPEPQLVRFAAENSEQGRITELFHKGFHNGNCLYVLDDMFVCVCGMEE